MKKIFILIIFIFLCTGCLDYQEINDIALVTGIGIDYQDNEYIVSLEVLNENSEKDSNKITSYIVEGKSKSLANAINDASSKLNDEANFSHTEVMLLSKNILEDKFSSIIDYFLRSTKFRENLYVLASLDNTPEEIFKEIIKKEEVATKAITSKMSNTMNSNNNVILKDFERVIKEITSYGKDTCFTNLAIKDEDIIVDGAVLFNDYEYKDKLSNDEVIIYNLFLNNINNYLITNSYDNKDFTISLNDGNLNIDIINNNLNITGNLTGIIINNEPSLNIKDLNVIESINNDFKMIIDKNIKDFLKHIQNINSDILGIDNLYYKKTRNQILNYLTKLDINVDTTFKINKKGIIYEVENEK